MGIDSEAINANRGIVVSTSLDGNIIKIKTPRGGTFTCKNKGFETGERICFTLDALKQNVVKILPEEVADIKWALSQDAPVHGVASIKPPWFVLQDTDADLNLLFEEVLGDEEFPENEATDGDGPEDEVYTNICSGEFGSEIAEWVDFENDQD
jgi:hypothetical protein